MDKQRFLQGKIEVTGIIKCLTGLHIGASKDTVEIGGIDLIVVRDPITKEPVIPGSSVKGKMRSLLEKSLKKPANRDSGSGVKIHVCDDAKEAYKCEVCRLFGTTGTGKDASGNRNKNFPSRLTVRDSFVTEESMQVLRKLDTGLLYTEWKFENVIDRNTSAANPRQIERVPKGTEFDFSMVYDVEDLETLQSDMNNLQLAVNLLLRDYLGGHGSRGYGKIDLVFKSIVFYSIPELAKPNPVGIRLDNLLDIEKVKNAIK